MGFFGSLFCCFPGSGSRSKKSRRGNDQSNSEENSLLENHGSSSHPRNPENDASSITSFGNAGEGNAGNKAYGATRQDDVRQREEDEREREERERERLLAIAGQAGNRMISLNRPSSPLTSHTHSPQSSRPTSPTLQPQDTNSQHSTDPSTHAVPLNPVKQVNLGLARTGSAASGRGKRGSAVGARKSTSLRRKEVRQDSEQAPGKAVVDKVEEREKSVTGEPEVIKAVETPVQPTVQEDPIVVEGSTSVPKDEIKEPTISTHAQASSPKTTETPITNVEETTKQSDSRPVDVESVTTEDFAGEQPEPLQPQSLGTPASPVAQSSTSPIPIQPEPEKPVISYAAVAAAESPKISLEQPSQAPTSVPETEEPTSKLGLDLHGQSSPTTTTEPQLPAEEPLVQSVEAQHVPSSAEVVAPVMKSEQPSVEATPDASTPSAEAAGAKTPSSESVDGEQATAGDAGASKAGKSKGKGKGGKGKKKKGKK